jgi:hypothetical protein
MKINDLEEASATVSSSLLPKPDVEKPTSWSSKSKLVTGVTTVLLLSVAIFSNTDSLTNRHQELSKTSTPTQRSRLSVTRLGYDEIADHTLQDVYQLDHVVEPDATMILKVKDCESCSHLSWNIVPKGERGSVTLEKTDREDTITAVFTDANSVYSISVTHYGLDGSTELLNYDLTCKYVRRELRTLNDEDIDRFFKALKVIYSTSQEEGEALYGKDYLSHAYMAASHNSNTYRYHGNMFFLTSHPVMQIRFEKSILAVDKGVVLNYWDFMKDSTLGRNWADSEIYSDKMFGPVRTTEAESFRPSGLFHDVKYVMDPDNSKFPKSATTPHGYLGSPEMTSDSIYLQRSNNYCGFESVQGQVSGDNVIKCFDKFHAEHDLREFDMCLELYVHANLHMMHAGQWNCAVSWSDFYEDNSDWVDDMFLSITAVSMSQMTISYSNNGYVSCPEQDACVGENNLNFLKSCRCMSSIDAIAEPADVDTLSMAERFEYAQDAWATLATMAVGGHDYLVFVKEYICDDTTYNNVFVPANIMGGDDLQNVESAGPMDNIKLDKLNTLILKTILFQGDYGITMSGAAPTDPIFWAMHPMFDKVMHSVRLSSNYNTQGFEWNNIKTDLKWEGMTPFTQLDFQPYADPSAFAKLGNDRSAHLKNSELWDLLHPNAKAISYIYDQFTEWGEKSFDPFDLGNYAASYDDDDSAASTMSPFKVQLLAVSLILSLFLSLYSC